MPDFSFTWSALEELECQLREIRRYLDACYQGRANVKPQN